MKVEKRHHGNKWMPAMYVVYFGILEKIANEHGYALCVHGTITRDFDLVAIPFDEQIKPREELLTAIKKAVGMKGMSDDIFGVVGYQPHGRICYTIECGAGGYFDISFTPTMQEAMKKVKEDLQKEIEMKNLIAKSKTP